VAAQLSASARVIITSDEIPAEVGYLNAYIVETDASLPVELGPVGGPQVWDFTESQTAVDSSFVSIDRIVSGSETPFTAQFPKRTLSRRMENASIGNLGSSGGYQYNYLNEQGYDFLVSARTCLFGTAFAVVLTPPLPVMPLPLAYGSSWSGVSGFCRHTELCLSGNSHDSQD